MNLNKIINNKIKRYNYGIMLLFELTENSDTYVVNMIFLPSTIKLLNFS